jgi:hypothetical protein
VLVLEHGNGEIIYPHRRARRAAVLPEFVQQARLTGPRHDSNPHELILPRRSDT